MSTLLKIPVSKTDHSEGPDKAPLILVKYGDYECPYCGQAFPIVKRIQKFFKGDLKFVFRNFPLATAHPNAMAAAAAAEAAGLQGKFWEMHDLLYQNQENLDGESLLKYGEKLKLDMKKYKNDMAGQEVADRIAADFDGGVRSGVNGTPSFFINGARFDGDWSYDSLLNVLKKVRDMEVED
jgi:protein-disulfide isomerase